MTDLSIPRFKVTIHYPDSPFKVGQILYLHYGRPHPSVNSCTLSPIYDRHALFLKQSQVERCSGIFKPLEWWDERINEDMPEYLRYATTTIVKVAKYDMKKFTAICDKVHHRKNHKLYFGIDNLQPATKKEYDMYMEFEKFN